LEDESFDEGFAFDRTRRHRLEEMRSKKSLEETMAWWFNQAATREGKYEEIGPIRNRGSSS
jgi:hypothetical protein